MKSVVEINNLPPGSAVRGFLYDDPTHVYGLGDVLEVELPNGIMIDVGWDEDMSDKRFHIVVYQEYYGNVIVENRFSDVRNVVDAVQVLSMHYSQFGPPTESPAEISHASVA